MGVEESIQLEAQLAELLGDRWSASVRVSGLHRLSGGASRETWAFEAVSGNEPAQPLVLQRERPGGVRTGGGMAAEGDLVRLAAANGVPVAEVIATDRGGGELGAPFVISRRVAGETIPRKLMRDVEFDGVRPLLARQAGRALGLIHQIPVASVSGSLDDGDQIEQFRGLLDVLGEPHPAFELGLRWLDHRRPPRRATTIVHGDFRTGNLVVDDTGLVAVLDWELAHVGDPTEDLGWFCVRAWRFGSPERAGGFGPLSELLAGYSEATGVSVDPDDVRWWEAMGTLKWGVMCIIQASTHLNGASRSVELAAIGRRAAENEWDLLELIR